MRKKERVKEDFFLLYNKLWDFRTEGAEKNHNLSLGSVKFEMRQPHEDVW